MHSCGRQNGDSANRDYQAERKKEHQFLLLLMVIKTESVDSVRTVPGVELVVDHRHGVLDRAQRDSWGGRDFLVRHPLGDHPPQPGLSGRQCAQILIAPRYVLPSRYPDAASRPKGRLRQQALPRWARPSTRPNPVRLVTGELACGSTSSSPSPNRSAGCVYRRLPVARGILCILLLSLCLYGEGRGKGRITLNCCPSRCVLASLDGLYLVGQICHR